MRFFPRLIVFLCVLCLSRNLFAQTNLIPNYSFEDTVACPAGPVQVPKAMGWTDPASGFSQYFNTCSQNSQNTIPANNYGYQNPRTGHAFAGIQTYSSLSPAQHSYLEIRLDSTLSAGVRYCFKLYLSKADNSIYASDGVGAYFSTAPITGNCCFLSCIPQINPGNLNIDTLHWLLLGGSFVASGGENYVTIGNFNTDQNTLHTITPAHGNNPFAFYYIDDVYLGRCDTVVSAPQALSIPNVFSPNGDGKNDQFKIAGLTDPFSLEIYDRWGVLVFKTSDRNQSWDGKTKTGAVCAPGNYYYLLELPDGSVKKGFLELIR